ncbi:MAG TPA: Rrf2 family transcriptional regulator [Phycisphaerae bacterium]|jgi:Rrf2 family protein|nr:Rrf2 family transcriptional regulator [Phycisphaerae bacterium]HOB75516.1 Rrf2 family transcriptional regulator [Phycisphaerae bacterium]HOJ55893.1 Rrf2 family transcriptional regulator [Phycisphaerae bacterium]HOL27157.1 Rrf2 family transcriptional regulator [Phycisphaerae bacterium]HPP21564.1 Rrf2 family transcriptional regulator [Phycisphaerae bacterium]
MLSLTRKTDYALIALAHMAQTPEDCCSAREIASRYGVPLPLLMNILKLLTRQGLAKSARGPRGGYTLAVLPSEITLYDVIRAVEGPVQLVQCADHHSRGSSEAVKTTCGLISSCPVYSPIQLVHNKLIEFLSGVSLADVVKQSRCECAPELVGAPGDSFRATVDLSGL